MAVQNKFEVLGEAEEVDQQQVKFKAIIPEAAEEQIPKEERKIKQRWMTEDILDLMEKRRHVKNKKHCTCIRKSEKNVMKQMRSGSMTSVEKSNCTAEVQSRQCKKKITEIFGKKTHSSTGCLK